MVKRTQGNLACVLAVAAALGTLSYLSLRLYERTHPEPRPKTWAHSYLLVGPETLVLTDEADVENVRTNLARDLGVPPETLKIKALK
jgi:hypothetical protein